MAARFPANVPAWIARPIAGYDAANWYYTVAASTEAAKAITANRLCVRTCNVRARGRSVVQLKS